MQIRCLEMMKVSILPAIVYEPCNLRCTAETTSRLGTVVACAGSLRATSEDTASDGEKDVKGMGFAGELLAMQMLHSHPKPPMALDPRLPPRPGAISLLFLRAC